MLVLKDDVKKSMTCLLKDDTIESKIIISYDKDNVKNIKSEETLIFESNDEAKKSYDSMREVYPENKYSINENKVTSYVDMETQNTVNFKKIVDEYKAMGYECK